MMASKSSSTSGSFSLKLALVYLLSSFLASLLFSALALRSRSNGNGGWVWIVLSLICLIVFGTISYSLIITSSPTHDSGWYYLGCSALFANGLSVLLLIVAFFKRK
jgi:hypothetical protein